MKKKSLRIKIKIIVCLMVFIFSISTTKAVAPLPVVDIKAIVAAIKQAAQMKDQISKTVKVVYQTTATAKAATQGIQNFNMSQLASSLSSDAMTQVGDIVTQNLGTLKDPSTNVLTNGQQIITDLNSYINKSSTNAIKKTLDDFQGANTNPYQSTALSDTIKKLRNDAQSSVNKLKVVGLASVAQKEICNNTKLKDVIKNGEPASWVNPKPALKNVNIDQLCNANLAAPDQGRDQTDKYSIATWTTPVNRDSKSSDIKNLKAFLFDKGYFITAPSSSIFNSATADAVKAFQKDQGLDQSGEVDDLTQTAMLAAEVQTKSISGKAAQSAWISIANAGYGGSLTRVALSDPSNSPLGVQASVQAEINKKIADSQFAATNKYNANGGIIGNEKCLDKNGNVKKFDPTDPTTAYCDNIVTSASSSAVKIKADLDAARQSPYLGILAKANNTGDCAGLEKVLKNSTSTCKSINKANNYISIVNSILGMASNSSGNDGINIKDSQFAQLASSLDELRKLDQSKGALSSAATANTNNYNTSQNQALTLQNNTSNASSTSACDEVKAETDSMPDTISAILQGSDSIDIKMKTIADMQAQLALKSKSNNCDVQPVSPYSGKRFDYDNNFNDRVLLNNLMSIVKVNNLSNGNTQTLTLELNSIASQDWGIDPNSVSGTFKIINKNTGKTFSTGDIGSTSIPNNSLVTNSGKKFKIFDAYILDNFKDDINANGGIKNTIFKINFNVYFKTLDPQKNPSDFTLDIGFYIDGSKY